MHTIFLLFSMSFSDLYRDGDDKLPLCEKELHEDSTKSSHTFLQEHDSE